MVYNEQRALINMVKNRNFFTVKLDHLGSNNGYGNIELFTNENAAELIEKAVIVMAKEMVGGNDVQLSFTVAMMLLKDTMPKETFSKVPNYEELDKLKKYWEIKQDGDK
jgi:hypothetical protein